VARAAPAGAVDWTMRLSAFRFSSFSCRKRALKIFLTSSLPGFDPAIHAAKRLGQNSDWLASLRVSMDHRVKPGGDEMNGVGTTRAQNAPRERRGFRHARSNALEYLD
jgi:hypothetical protein